MTTQPTGNDALLAKLREILPQRAYEAAQQAASKGPLALKVSKNPNGTKIVHVVAVRAGRIGGGAYHKTQRDPSRSKLYNLEPTTVDVERQRVSHKTRTKGDESLEVPTLDAQPALYVGGTVAEIDSFFAKNATTYAIFYSSSKEFTGQDEPDEMDLAMFPEQFEGQAMLEPGTVHVYVSGLGLVEAGQKDYKSVGSLGDVIADVTINVVNFAAGGAGGAAGEPTTAMGEAAHSALELIGGAKDAKEIYDKYFKPKSVGESLWSRDFVEKYLQLEVCVTMDESRGPSISLASDASLKSKVLKIDGKDMLGISLGKVQDLLPELLDQAFDDLEASVSAKGGTGNSN
jgi:hypothetical protein